MLSQRPEGHLSFGRRVLFQRNAHAIALTDQQPVAQIGDKDQTVSIPVLRNLRAGSVELDRLAWRLRLDHEKVVQCRVVPSFLGARARDVHTLNGGKKCSQKWLVGHRLSRPRGQQADQCRPQRNKIVTDNALQRVIVNAEIAVDQAISGSDDHSLWHIGCRGGVRH